MTATCEPPPEHRGHRWHWLRYRSHPCEPCEWREDKWVTFGERGLLPSGLLYRSGWRYVGPAIPPAVEEG